jgi:hypothetical protein
LTDPWPARRQVIIALLETLDDWVKVPGARTLSGEGELISDSERAAEDPRDVRARERRYAERLDAEAAARRGESPDGRTRNEAARHAHYSSGSYAALDRALHDLKRKQTYSYWLVDRLYVQGLPLTVQDYRLDAALRSLSDRLPLLLICPATLLEPTTMVERDRRICAWSAAGRSTRWIGGKVGLSHVRVSKIILAGTERPAA